MNLIEQKRRRRLSRHGPCHSMPVITEVLEQRQLLTPTIASLDRLPTAAGEFDFQISGTAEAGSQVSVRQAGVGVVGQTHAMGSGTWTINVDGLALANGRFEFSATEGDPAAGSTSWSDSKVFQPNILLVNVDDMRADDLPYMPFVSSVLASQGTVFTNMFTPTALCGPSRATLMTGLFAERSGISGNSGPLGGSVNLDLSSSLPVWLDNAGYRTGLFGKDRTTPWIDQTIPSQKNVRVSPGWDEYFSFTTGQAYSGFVYKADHNGTLQSYSNRNVDYATDVLHRKVTEFIDSSLAADSPFFAYMAPVAPHYPFTPAPRHFGTLNDSAVFHSPSFNLSESGSQPFDDAKIVSMDNDRRRARESLLAVDESIQTQYSQLSDAGALDNTVIVFTSDNGYLFGEHGVIRKNMFYDEAMRVPLIVWDGRQATQSTSDALVLNADIGPTIAWMTGAATPADLDGKNLVPLMTSPTASVRDDFLIYHRYADPSWSHDEVGVRNKNWVYATRSDGTTFLFDMENDPYQLLNLAANSEYAVVRDTLAARLEELRPSDRVAPIATQVSVALAPEAANGSRAIRITANVTDLEHGNSEIRTPELIFSLATSPGYGIPLDAVDGRFDSETEDTFLDLTVNQYFAAGSPETVYLRFRDVPGNWSDPYPVSLSLNSSLHLNAESDTGDSSSDGVTVDNQPKFSGSGSAPGATITLFAARLSPTVSAAIVVGTVTADSNGDWEVTSLPFASAGVYLINGVERSLDEQGQPRTVLFRPFSLHLLAVRGPLGSVFITGTTSDDQIRVSASFGESLNFWLNDVWAGALPAGTALNIQGAAGDDRLEVNGNLPASLFGGPGNDTLIGGTGIDVLSGGAGSNQLLGGPGDDTYLFDDIGVVDLMAVSLTDLVDEHSNEGFDSFSFVTPFGIVADLNPDSADPSVVMKSPYRVQRTIKFETPGFVRNVERLDGSIVRDSIRVGPQNFVQGRGGNDQISVMPPMVPGQTLALRQLTSGLAFASSTSISASIQASKGTLSLNKVLPTEISFSQLTDQRIQLQGPLVSVNSFLNSDGLKFTAPETFTGRITLTLRSFPESAPATSESDIATFAVTYQPSIVTGGAVQWTEGGHPVFLAPVGTASDQDANFTGAVLKASGLTFFDSSDRLMIIPETPAPGAVTLDGSLVLFGGVPVGTWTFFSSSQELLVTFNQSATNAALQAIVRRIGFENSSQDPIGGNRTIRFQVVDGAGLGSTVSTTTVLVKPTRVIIQNQVLTLREDANTSSAVMLGSILVKDDPLETSVFSLSGTDADSFQMTERVLSLKPDTLLNASTKASYQVSVTANDATTGDIIGVSADYVLSITSTVPVITSPLTSRTLLPTFKWNAVPGAVSYDIWIRNATTQQDSYRTASTSNLFYTPAANLEIGRFDARVRSVNVNGRKSDWSDPVQITINTAVKLKPLALLQTTRPMISWLVLPGAVSYDVWVDTVPAATSPFLLQSGLTKTLFRPSGDLSMGTYRVLVRGIDAEGISAAWSVASPFTIAPAPSLLSPLTATFDRTPEFEWTAVNGALNYEIVVTSILTGQTVIQTTVTTNQFASAAVLPAGFYAWKVRANGPQSIVGRFSTIVQIHIGGRPKILGPVGQSPSVPVFLWTPVQWAATYELRVDRTDVEMIGVINLSNLNTNTYVPGASLIAGTYRFWVRAVSTSGSRSIWSIAATFQIASAEAGLSRPLALYLQPLPVALNRQVMALSDFQTTLSPTPAISFVDSAATAETGKLAVDFETKWSDDMPALITDEYFSMICDRLAPAADYF